MTATAAAPVPAPGQGPPLQNLTSDVAVDAQTRMPGDGEFLQGNVACMAAETDPCFPPEGSAVVVSTTRRPTKPFPSTTPGSGWLVDGPWEAHQRCAFTMALVVSPRKAHDASSTTVSCPDSAHCRRRNSSTRDTSSPTWEMALGWTSITSTAPPTVGPTGIRELATALRPGTAPAAAPATGITGALELEGTRPAMTTGLAATRVTPKTVEPLAAKGLEVGETEGRGKGARATGAIGKTAHGETLLEPTPPAPPWTSAENLPSLRSRTSPARGK